MNNMQTGHPGRKQWGALRKGVQAQAVSISQEELVRTSLEPGTTLPLIVQPAVEGVDLTAWAANNRDFIESKLIENGAILFRGFNMEGASDLERFLDSILLRSMHYMEGATPRTSLGERVYTSTEYPPDQSIALHNELNYVVTWPMRIIFFCDVAADRGGATPIADVRKVYQRIDPEIRERFEEEGWMLLRNFGDGLSLPWQRSFRLEDPSDLEAYCRNSHIEFDWKSDDRLRTRQVRPAIRRHPVTGEPVWFNHVAFWHVSSLDKEFREMYLPKFKEEDLPYNTYYGKGMPIEDSVVEQLRAAYDAETVALPWKKNDLLLMDNMLVAHGREPFEGSRKVLVSMGNPYSDFVPGVGFKKTA